MTRYSLSYTKDERRRISYETNSIPRGSHGTGHPMQPDGSLDLETLSRLTEWQIQSSISALVPCGTTGEAATLTDEERFTVNPNCSQNRSWPGAGHRWSRMQ